MALNNAQTAEDLAGAIGEPAMVGGVLNESVLNALFDVSNVNLPLLSRIGRDTHDHVEHSWVQDRLNSAAANAVADGAEDVAEVTGNQRRIWNFSQISAHRFKTTQRAINADPIGYANHLAKGVRDRSLEVMRDVEFQLTANNASVVNSGPTAAEAWGLEAFLDNEDHAGNTITNKQIQVNSAGTIASGGWENVNTTTKVVPAYSYTTVTANVLQIADIENVASAIWELGGMPNIVISRTRCIREVSKFLFDSSNARIATLQSDQGVPSGGGEAQGLTAVSAVSVFITNFGVTLQLVPSRIMPEGDSGDSSTTLFVGDTQHMKLSTLQPLQVSEIGKLGLTESREVSIDWTSVITSSDSWGMVQGIAEATPVVA